MRTDRRRSLLAAAAMLLCAAGALLAMVVLGRLVPDAPPRLLLGTPADIAVWVVLDRVLLGTVCVGLVACAALAGRAFEHDQRSLRLALVAMSVLVIAFLGLAVLWGTGETADEQGVRLDWIEPVTLATLATVGVSALVAAGSATLSLRRPVPRN